MFAPTPQGLRTGSRTMSQNVCSSNAVVDSNRSSFSERFGDPSTYHNLQRDPHIHLNREIKPKIPEEKWSKSDYYEFEEFLSHNKFSMKTVFDNGRIFITEVQPDAAHQVCSRKIIAPFIVRNFQNRAINGDDLFELYGTTMYQTTGDYIADVDEQIHPNLPAARSSSLFVEVANIQTVASGFAKAKAFLSGSTSLRYMLLVKIYRSPVPMEVAMTACIWEKDGDTAEGTDWIATRFVSFGSRALTDAELGEYPAVEMDSDPAQLLSPVVNFLEEEAGSMQINPLIFTMEALFDLPNQVAPADIAAMEDVKVDLVTLREATVRGILYDVLASRWKLENDDLLRILNEIPADPTHQFAHLREYALANYMNPVCV